jgi:hypothetical protein
MTMHKTYVQNLVVFIKFWHGFLFLIFWWHFDISGFFLAHYVCNSSTQTLLMNTYIWEVVFTIFIILVNLFFFVGFI